MLSTLLASVAGERVFIVCRIEPKETGGTNKTPVDPLTGENNNAQNPTTWLTLAEAQDAVVMVSTMYPCQLGYAVGIVIHENLGLFCIDIDSAYVNDAWSPMAQQLCARFAGAYIEISHSGTGLHIFGCRALGFPDHRTRKKGLKLEVYTRRRFILVTGTAGSGDIRTDHTAALQQTIAEYLPEEISGSADEWTTGPYAGWRGGGSDEQIIAMLRNRIGTHAAFGMGATFADLYDGNVDVLAKAFPPETGNQQYGYSAADQALANHLAWGTGYDCERTLRLMQGAKIARDKWNREDYLPRTILKAIAGKIPEPKQPDAAQDYAAGQQLPPVPAPPESHPQQYIDTLPEAMRSAAPLPPLPPMPNAPTESATFFNPAPGTFLTQGEQQALFNGCVYIEDIHGILMPDGTILAQKQFDVRFGGFDFQMRVDGTKQSTSAWDAFTGSQLCQFPRAHGLCFDPLQPPRAVIHRDNFVFINSWVPVPIKKVEGDVTPFLTHLWTLYPNGNDPYILLAYFAFLVQYPGVKAQWWPMLQGVEGNGKTFFSLVLEYCVGQRYTHHAKASQLDNRFNSALYGKLLICVEDVHITEAKSSMWETLKPMITNTRMEIEGKGLDKVTRDVCFNGIMNSNHKDGVRKTRNDRRVAPFFGAQQYESDLVRCGLTKKYFQDLYGWAKNGGYAAIAHFLTHYKIPDDLNPAVGAIRAPNTSSTEQAINVGRGGVEQEVQEAIESGREGFRNGWINSIAFDRLLTEQGKARYLPRSKRGDLLESMGYRPHPKLPNGRVIRALPDGTKPTLYIKDGHETSDSPLDWRDLPMLYVKDQAPEK